MINLEPFFASFLTIIMVLMARYTLETRRPLLSMYKLFEFTFILGALCRSSSAFTSPLHQTPQPFTIPNTQRTTSSPPALAATSFTPPNAQSLSSNLISSLAVLAIQSRLQHNRQVTCDISFPSPEALWQGCLGPVTVAGKDWVSPSGQLTCRAIEATVNECKIDIQKVLTTRKIVLHDPPATGKAMVALEGNDFGNFITHPRLRKLPGVTFVQRGATIDGEKQWVEFYVQHQSKTFVCHLQRNEQGQRRAKVTACLDDGAERQQLDERLSLLLEDFFNELAFELDGAHLSFRDMRVTTAGPSLMLSLGICVDKFPSPGVDF